MELIFNNQISIFEDIFSIYLTPKQCIKFYSSNNILYNIYLNNNKFEHNYYKVKSNLELQGLTSNWCRNKEAAIIKYGHISYWDTSNITSMCGIFYNKQFNDNISDWNTSNVINMNSMFEIATKFNQPIGNWNISNVKSMNCMFHEATEFNQSIEKWDTSNITDLGNMFSCATNFNQSIENWDISNVTDMTHMFCLALNFNQDLNKWNIDNVKDITNIFKDTQNFNKLNYSKWGINYHDCMMFI